MRYFQTLGAVLKLPRTYLYMLLTTSTVYVAIILLSQGVNMWNILFLDIPFVSKLSATISFFTSTLDTFSYQSFLVLVITSCVVGVQFALVRLYAKDRLYLAQNKLNIVGIMATLLGCLACCGSIVFSIISSLIGVSLQGILPFAGAEFSYIGLLIACIGCYMALRAYHRPTIC